MTKLELKSSHEVVDTVNVADVESIFYGKPTDPDILTVVMKDGTRLYCDEVCPINSLQEEPMKIRKGCKYRCKNDMRNNDTGKISFIGGKIYYAPEDDMLVSEENGWRCDTSEDASNFELVEETVSEELEEAAVKIAKKITADTNSETVWSKTVQGVIAGANWQKQQMMEDAVDGRFSYNHNFKEYEFICLEKSDTPEHYIGELVKVIIIKQEEE